MARSSTRTERALAAAVLFLALAAVPALGCHKNSAHPSGPPVHVIVTVDWEGAYLDDRGVDELAHFRDQNPGVPVTHFLNAAYYTKPGAVAADVTRTLQAALHAGDEAGLHVHLWRSLVSAAGVEPADGPSFLRKDGPLLKFDDDVGFDLDPRAYDEDQMRTIIRHARAVLASHGIEVVPAFRAPGWLGEPHVLAAARAEGFTIDASATDPALVAHEGVDDTGEDFTYLAGLLEATWPRVDRTTQPYWIDTPAGRLLEIPDGGCLADFVTNVEMEDDLARAAKQAAAHPDTPVTVQIGLHVETADDYAERVSKALANVRRRNIPVVYETLTQAAARIRRAGNGVGQPGGPDPHSHGADARE